MKNILIVDDDNSFLLSLTDGLRSHDADFNVLTAGNGREAVDVLNAQSIDLVVTDIKMPEMSGFELLAFMSRQYNEIPIIVITAFGTPEIEKNIKTMGAVQYLEKPLDFNILVEKIYRGLKEKADGFIKGISLTSILQIVEMEKESCTLVIKSHGQTGTLYVENGQLLDAVSDEHQGLKAALEIVTWEETQVEIDKKCPAREQVIYKSLDFLIIEGHRLKDERLKPQAAAGEPTPDDADSKQTDTSEILLTSALLDTPATNQHVKESHMNIQKLNEAIGILKQDLGEGLLACDIYSIDDGQSIAGYNSQPKACALFNQITEQMNSVLGGAGFPILGRYYILDLADKKMVVVIPLGDYQWGILMDGTKVKLGLLLNIAMPKIIDAFEEAITM